MTTFLNCREGYFEVEQKKITIKELEKEINNSDFWNDSKHSTKIIEKLNSLKRIVEKVEKLRKKIDSNIEMLKFNDEVMNEIINNDVATIKEELNDLEVFALLNGPL